MLDGMVVAGDDLPAKPLSKVNNKRRLEIDGERACRLTDDHENLRVGRIGKSQRLNISTCHPAGVLRYESARADDGQCHFSAFQALEPCERRVLGIGEQHPPPTLLHTDQSVDESEYVGFLDAERAEPCRIDIHVDTRG